MKNLLLSIFLPCLFLNVYTQDVNIGGQGVALVDCANTGHLYDSGGNTASYSAGESFVLTICSNPPPPASLPVALSVVSTNFGHPNDFLAIYDGANTIASTDLIYSFSQSASLNTGTILRTTIANTSGCITIQFVSDPTSTGGNIDFEILCLPPCKSVIADFPVTSIPVLPNDTNYINSCFGDIITFTGHGIYDSNTSIYTQDDNTSNFYWDFGSAGLDTGQTVLRIFNPGIYPVKLIVEDVSGCISFNEINLKIRQTLIPDVYFLPADTTVCENETLEIIPYLVTTSGDNLMVGDTAPYDTLKTQTKVSIQDTSYLPDDSDGITGNGITTPAIFDFPIFGYLPGATLQDVNDLFYVCIDMEHSFIGDLDIILECPNGQTVTLIDFSPPAQANGWNLGEPVFGTAPGQPGIPYTYCWSPSANVQDTIGYNSPVVLANLINGNTVDTSIMYSTPGNDWANLLGCPLNGTWTIQVFDDYGSDDGYVFGAAIEFNGSFALDPDTFLVAYMNPFWDASNQITSNLNNDSISFQAVNNPYQTMTFHFEDNLGCSWSNDYDGISVSSINVTNAFQDTTICGPDSLTIFANVGGANPSCDYTLEMFDAFGDSWNGNFITVYIDGVLIDTFEVDGVELDESIETFTVQDGQQIQIEFDDNGSFVNEVSYNLVDPNGFTVFSSANPPVGGIVFTTIADCFGNVTFNWTPISEIVSTFSNQAHIYPTTDTEYYVEVVNQFGCTAYDTSNVYFNATISPVIDFSTLPNKFCCEDTELDIDINDYVSGPALAESYWNGNLLDGDSFDISSSDFNNDTITVLIKVIADNGCFSLDTVSFYRYCLNPSITVVDSIFVGDSKIFDLTVTEYDSMSYAWTTTDNSSGAITDPSVQDAVYNGLYEGLYEANVAATAYFNQNDNTVLACEELAEAKNYEVVDILSIEYPDAFTPNNSDELNDIFRPIISEYAEILEFRIYNRWGDKVYDIETADNKDGWDGKVKGKDQNAGVYTYFMNIKHFDDNFIKEGIVNLIR